MTVHLQRIAQNFSHTFLVRAAWVACGTILLAISEILATASPLAARLFGLAQTTLGLLGLRGLLS